MASQEDEIKDLREKNNDLVQKVQYWKMTAAQRENEKLDLMKENNQLRLKLSRIRSGGTVQARELDAAMQANSKEALSHLVQASGAVARNLDLAKKYFQDREELEASCQRWSNISGTPTPEKVHKVLPMMIGGRSIQPVVSLRRASFSNSNLRNISRSPNQNRSLTERAMPVPMHMLQDVYIPLTRIDAVQLMNNEEAEMEAEMEADALNDSAEALGLENENEEQAMDVSNNSLVSESYDDSRRLDAVTEDVEPEDEPSPQRPSIENPMEGPSWLLDMPYVRQRPLNRVNFEPDSTTELYENQVPQTDTPPATTSDENERQVPLAFTPTVRRRKRSSSPSVRQSPARRHDSGRVLKVLVAKMKLDGEASSPKRPAVSFSNVPSPNGATDTGVIVLENQLDDRHYAGGDPPPLLNNINVSRREGRRSRDSNSSLAMRHSRLANQERDATEVTQESKRNTRDRSRDRNGARERSHDSNDSRGDSDSDISERTSDTARSRRVRKPVTYREPSIQAKMRR